MISDIKCFDIPLPKGITFMWRWHERTCQNPGQKKWSKYYHKGSRIYPFGPFMLRLRTLSFEVNEIRKMNESNF